MAATSNDWDDDLDAAPLGLNAEMVRKALKLNPALRQLGDTAAVLEHLNQKTPLRAPKPIPDLLKTLEAVALRLDSEKKRIADEIQQLQAQRKALSGTALDEIIDAIIEIDPNMVSPRTGEVLSRFKPLLAEIGFSVKRVVDKQVRK